MNCLSLAVFTPGWMFIGENLNSKVVNLKLYIYFINYSSFIGYVEVCSYCVSRVVGFVQEDFDFDIFIVN